MLRITPVFRAVSVFAAFLLVGCSTTKVLTISTQPPDSLIKLDGNTVGKGKSTQTMVFDDKAKTHTVSVSRLGFATEDVSLTKDYNKDTVDVALKPASKHVTFTISPLPGTITIDGKPLSTEPTDSASAQLEFAVDARDNWVAHVATVTRSGYERADQVIRWEDKQTGYAIHLEPRKKDLSISTTPAGAVLFLDDQPIGTSPMTVSQRPFPPDPDSGEAIAQKLRATKAGYPDVEIRVGWDDSRTDYHLDLVPRSKLVKVTTDPSGASVTIDGKELPRDPQTGVTAATLAFPPIDDKGTPRTFTATVTKKTADSEWYPKNLPISWDDGRTDYVVTLKEIRTRPVAMISPVLRRGDEGWEVVPEITQTIAMKDVSEGSQKQPPVQLTQFPKGTQIDSVSMSPDGTELLLTILLGTDKTNFRSQIVMLKADGTGGAAYLSDGKSLEITPSFSPGGDRVIFSSNRAGKRLSIWSMSSAGAPGITQLTSGDTNDLWPCMDSDPRPRLFYQASVDTRPDPRIYMRQLGATTLTDLTQMGGAQPRVSPKADSIVFCAVNDKTGKRDLYMMSDSGGPPRNLTNTPDVDEFDPCFSRDGSRICYVSDAGVDEERRHNYDIWAMDIARPDRPAQITTNGSWDDHACFDPTGSAIYFRSNRGGEWAAWKVSAK